MIHFPLKFQTEAKSSSGVGTKWVAYGNELPPIEAAIPLEFSGPGGGYSPEDFFALALLNCLIAMFKVYCEKSNLSFQEIKGKVILTVDRVPGQAGFAMTQADVFLDVSGASDADRVRKTLESAIKDCPVSNSIKTGKTFQINIS